MGPVDTGKKDLASAVEIRNPLVSWEWEEDLGTCDDLVAMLRCSTCGYPCEPEENQAISIFLHQKLNQASI